MVDSNELAFLHSMFFGRQEQRSGCRVLFLLLLWRVSKTLQFKVDKISINSQRKETLYRHYNIFRTRNPEVIADENLVV
jgi:hypothetical protein